MFQTREEDTPAYLNFINLCGFFETVGLLCKRGHVDLDEILDLYANAIVTTADATQRCAESVTGTQSNLDGELYLSGW